MSTINNNGRTSAASSANRVAGLFSGLQTEDLVKAMTANTKKRINSQQQKLQTLQWKQDSYRSIIDKISDFKNKYLDIMSSTSIKTNANLRKCVATSTNEKVITASASAGASPGKYIIKEATAAKSASITTVGSAAEGSIKMDFSKAVNGKNYEVSIKLDGAEKKVVFAGGANADATKANFISALNLAAKDLKSSTQSFTMDGDWLRFDSADDGVYHTFEVSSCEGLGLSTDATSKITKASTLGSIGFKQDSRNLIGYDININGKEFHFTDKTTVSEMINTINDSGIGVRMSFSNVSQSFTLETKDTGAAQELTISQKNGHLLNALFNIGTDKLGTAEADSAKLEYSLYDSYTQSVGADLKAKFTTGFETSDQNLKMKLNVDGVDKEFTLDIFMLKKVDGIDMAFEDRDVNTFLNLMFQGSGITATYNDGNLTLKSDNGKKIIVKENDFMFEQGATNEKKSAGDRSYPITSAGVTELKFNVGGEEKTVTASGGRNHIIVEDLVVAGLFDIGSDGSLTAKVALSGADDATNGVLNDLFKKTSLIPAKTTDKLTYTGENSRLVLSSDGVNFTTYTSAASVFNFDGTNINVSNAKDFEAETDDDWITVESDKDVSGLKDLIKGFVEDYNKLLEDLYKETSTKRPKSKGAYYDPLTEEQEEEMSEKEIEKWNENAKTGLLYGDSNVLKFLGEIRSAMSTFVDKYGLYNMGIKLTDNWRDNGKLEIDEAKLETAIKADSDKIAELFTGKNGIAAKLETAFDKAISTKTKKYGYLTQLAGQKGTKTDTDNSIYKQIQSIKTIIDTLNEKYEKEQERYWNKYSQLEKLMAKMQQQSTIFADDSQQ